MEQDNREHPLVMHHMRRVMRLDESAGVFADIHISGMGPFSESEALWQKVLESLAWDSATGVALKFDGDELAHRVRHQKKRPRASTSSLPKLPARLRYLQVAMAELMSLPPEEVNEDWDASPLVKALKKRVKGLSPAVAEEQIETDTELLKQWIGEDPDSRAAGEFVAAFMTGFQFHLGDA